LFNLSIKITKKLPLLMGKDIKSLLWLACFSFVLASPLLANLPFSLGAHIIDL